MSLFNWFGSKKDDLQDIGMLFAEVKQRFDHLDEDEIKKVTGFAGLLGKVAYADMDFSSKEKEKMRRVLTNILKLGSEWVEQLIEVMTEHRIQLFSVEDHFYSRMVNDVCNRDQKRLLLEALFLMASVDESINNQEDAAIWTIAKSLQFSHSDFISARKRFRKHLDILKPAE